jgi:predicted nucleic acid-binding protein
VKPVLDTNILIDYLGGRPQAQAEIVRFPEAFISEITWIEVMAGVRDGPEQDIIRGFLQNFSHVAIDHEVAIWSVKIRREHRVKLPDAIIWATAKRKNTLLITRNTKGFPET